MFRLFRFFSTLAFVLLLAVWFRGYHFAEGFEATTPRGNFLLTTHPGRLRLCWPSPFFGFSTTCALDASSYPRDNPPVEEAWKGNEHPALRPIFSHGVNWIGAWPIRFVEISPAALTLLAGLYPAAFVIARIRKFQRTRSGAFCRVCEYDVRGIADLCPECGTNVRPPPLRRWWAGRLLIAATIVCLLSSGHWLARYDFRHTHCRNVDFATLGGFSFDQDKGTLADIPPEIRQLDGQRIAVEGLMIPMDQGDNISEFALVPRYLERMAMPIQETIVARIIDGRAVGYSPDRIRVFGTLHVRISRDEGYLVCIYDMIVDSVQPVPRR